MTESVTRHVLVRGADMVDQRLIYGLVDPKHPDRIRYVGQTTRAAVCRYVQHIGTLNQPTAKTSWLRSLRKKGRYPDMVLLEEVAAEDHIGDREFAWIMAFQQQDQADLNQPAPQWFRAGEPRPAQPWWVRSNNRKTVGGAR